MSSPFGQRYLVTLSHGMDDMPMRLCDDRDAALKVARSLPWQPTQTYLKRLNLADVSTPCCITITTFRDGKPIKREIVREYESELEAKGR
ncbi:MAG: hypothetical protein ACTHK7_18395 [Aureliella sp.]